MANPRVVPLIYSSDTRGSGTDDDPIRVVHYLHTLRGKFLLALDPSDVAGGIEAGDFWAAMNEEVPWRTE